MIAKKRQLNNRYKKNQQARKQFSKSHYCNYKTFHLVRSPVRNVKSTPLQSSEPNFIPKYVAKLTVTKHVVKPKNNAKSQVSKPFEKVKPKFSHKSNFSKTANASKDVKSKGKLVSEPKISSKDFEAQLKKGGKETW